MNDLQAITTVYSYYLPEIRRLIDTLTGPYPHHVFLRSISPGLDDFHEPIIEKLVNRHRRDVPQLGSFAYRYPTAGSEEGIREFLTLLQSRGVRQIYVWKGDYEGYREVAKTRNISTVELDYEVDPASTEPGYWFLSNPSARNGMLVPRERILAIAEAGHKIFYDLSYLGATEPAVFDVSHPNIEVAAVSFSKPFGLFYYRIGFTLSREEIPTLYANKWFKNIFGLLIAEKILDEIDQGQLSRKYRAIQAEIVETINRDTAIGLVASDVHLLAHLSAGAARMLGEEQMKMVTRFRRADWYRFCLTPYFEAWEPERT